MSITSVTNGASATDQSVNNEPDKTIDEDDSLDLALEQMASIYKSRCIQPQNGSNVTIRDINKDE